MVSKIFFSVSRNEVGEKRTDIRTQHCVKSVQIRSFLWSVYSRIRTEYREILQILSPNAGKYEPEKNSIFRHLSRSEVDI